MKKLFFVLAIGALVAFGRLSGAQAATPTAHDFTNDVAAGLQQQRVSQGAQTIKTAVTEGESRNAGDEHDKNIPEQDVEKEVEAEIDQQKAEASKESSTTKTDGATDSSTGDSSTTTDGGSTTNSTATTPDASKPGN